MASLARHFQSGRLDLAAHHQDVAVLPGADPRIGDRECVDEPAALGPDIQRGDRRNAELALEKYSVSGSEVVGTRRGVDDGVEVSGGEPRHLQGAQAGSEAEVDAGLAFADPAALLNPG